MAEGDSGGLVWKIQLVVFVVVALDAGRRVAGGLSLSTLDGVANLALLVLSVAGGLYVAWTRRPISALFGGGRGSSESATGSDSSQTTASDDPSENATGDDTPKNAIGDDTSEDATGDDTPEAPTDDRDDANDLDEP